MASSTSPSGLIVPATAANSDIVKASTSTRSADTQRLLDLINAHRKAKGLAPVKYSATLSKIGQEQSTRLVREEVIDHTDDFWKDERAGNWNAVGEIHSVSWQGTVTELMNWWKGSKAHNKVLTDPRMTVIGIGLTYVDGQLAGNKQGWKLVGTVASYGYPAGRAPADTRTSVGAAPAPAPAPSTAPITSAGHSVRGAIGRQYHALGGAAAFGAPTGPERGGLVGGGTLQGFAKGHTFYWSSATGAWPVHVNGAIGRTFAAHRWENGLGYPTTREITGLTGGGAYQMFRQGTAVHKVIWSPRTGAKVVKESGAIGQRWKAAGAERGYGYPVTDEYRYGTEVRQRFSHGYTIHWSSVTKRHWVTR